MRQMFRQMAALLGAGQDLVLVSVTASSGSTPRGAGARMLMAEKGRVCGTIGGGAVEYRSEQIAMQVLKERCSKGHDFCLTKDDVQNLGMICGGAVNVFFSFIPAYDGHCLNIAAKAEELFKKGEDLWLLSDINAGGRLGLYSKKEGFYGLELDEGFCRHLSRQPRQILEEGLNICTEQINFSGRVYVFGCGHVAQELVPVLSHVGFRCVAMDDREEFARAELMPGVEEVKLIDFSRIGDFVDITSEDYACVMTRGHAYDAIVQAQLLMTEACYIGVIGSAAKKAGVYKKLKEEYGFADEVFERINSPIGIDIKAETPAEIAISIAGEMIELRARRNRMR